MINHTLPFLISNIVIHFSFLWSLVINQFTFLLSYFVGFKCYVFQANGLYVPIAISCSSMTLSIESIVALFFFFNSLYVLNKSFFSFTPH